MNSTMPKASLAVFLVTILVVFGPAPSMSEPPGDLGGRELALAVDSRTGNVMPDIGSLTPEESGRQWKLELNYSPGMEITVAITGTGTSEVRFDSRVQEQSFQTMIKANCVIKEVLDDGDTLMEITTLEFSGPVSPSEMGLPSVGQTIRKLLDKLGNIKIVEGASGPGNYTKSDLVFPAHSVSWGEKWSTCLQLEIAELPIDLDIVYIMAGETVLDGRQYLKIDVKQKAFFQNNEMSIRVEDTGAIYLDPVVMCQVLVENESFSFLENYSKAVKVKGVSRTKATFTIKR